MQSSEPGLSIRSVQIELSKPNEKRLKELRRVYRKTCEDFDLSLTGLTNLLLRGRLTVALQEAHADLNKANQHKCHARNSNSTRS